MPKKNSQNQKIEEELISQDELVLENDIRENEQNVEEIRSNNYNAEIAPEIFVEGMNINQINQGNQNEDNNGNMNENLQNSLVNETSNHSHANLG